MSIYNGFPTRRRETRYLKLLYYMFVLMQDKIDSEYNNYSFNDSQFKYEFSKVYNEIKEMDKEKYLHPKFSQWFQDLAQTIGANKTSKKSLHSHVRF